MTPSTVLGTNAAFANAYDSKKGLRNAVNKALMDIGADLDESDEASTWTECLDCLEKSMASNISVDIVQGLPGEKTTLYPLATYGWDGGHGISTELVNLTKLVSVHIAGGPRAALVRRTDPSYPGLALHRAHSEGSLTVQLF